MKQNVQAIMMAALMLCAASLRSTAQAPATRIDPRNPSLKYLPELGRMVGKIPRIVTAGHGERYGAQVYKLFDCNNDNLNDWTVSRMRCDTAFNGRIPEEVLLYHGVKGDLPTVESGQRMVRVS